MPGWISFTITVPASVPSVFHSSSISDGVNAWNRIVLPAAANGPGFEGSEPDTMSITISVPSAVPSDFHGSDPLPSPALKKRMPFATVS